MSATHYTYTSRELDEIYTELEKTLFAVRRDVGSDGEPAPKILVVAGAQGSGKTYMLENTLLKEPRYDNYVRLYQDRFRELHPRYEEFAEQDVLSRYKHTEGFIWELCGRVFRHAYENKFNIIMETALDTRAFADVISGRELSDYQFDVHLIGCKKDFVHLSTIHRALNALEKGTLERFVDIATIETSIENAEVILNAFETACMRVSGSTIAMYERGFGTLKNRRKLCNSRCDRIATLTPYEFTDEGGTLRTVEVQSHRIERSELLPVPCSFATFIELFQTPVSGAQNRTLAWQEAYQALSRMRPFWKQVPARLAETLWGYIRKYAE
jgi:hypothetical protein